jgi:hypoxanthine phosphoribosyltransferase
MKSYNYALRSGVRQISWDDFSSLARHLAELVESYHPQLILGVARGGLFPATAVACSLRCELFPIRLTRRVDDKVVYEQPVWKVPVPPDAAGKVVAIIDEIADSGQTLAMVAESATSLGAVQVVTACLVSHTWANPFPQVSTLVSDELIIFPWDQQILANGDWVIHPEIHTALKAQNRTSLD